MSIKRHKIQTDETVTVHCGRGQASGLAVCSVAIAFIGMLLLTVRTTTDNNWSPEKTRQVTRIENVAAYETYARALQLLENGQAAQAGHLLDRVAQESLVINAAGTADGILSPYSPSSLLISVTRCLMANAAVSARAGKNWETCLWLHYMTQIAEQVARTPAPNNDSLSLSHSLDAFAAQTQEQVAEITGDHGAQVRAKKRREYLKHAWQTEVLPRLQENSPKTASDEMRCVQNRYGLRRMQAGLANV